MDDGASRQISAIVAIVLPFSPVNPMVQAPQALAVSSPRTTFLLLPEVLMPMTTSFDEQRASSCLEKTMS